MFAAWVECTHSEIERRASLLRKTAMRFAHATLVRTFEAWCESTQLAAEAQADREQRARTLVRQWLHRRESMTFGAWLSHAHSCKAIKRRAAYAIGPGRLLHMVMRTWVYVCHFSRLAPSQRLAHVLSRSD